MTLQIGLVGTDGILLASDQQTNNTSPGPQITTSHLTSKILKNDKDGVAACWSGCEDISAELAQRIVTQVDRHKCNQLLLGEMAEEAYKDAQKRIRDPYQYGDVLVVGCQHQLLFEVRARRKFYKASPYYSWICSGQDRNPALYFCEHFYKRKSIEELVLLAAHTILTAGKLDSLRVKGLEILRCTKEGFKFLTEEEREIARLGSEELYSRIETTLYSQP